MCHPGDWFHPDSTTVHRIMHSTAVQYRMLMTEHIALTIIPVVYTKSNYCMLYITCPSVVLHLDPWSAVLPIAFYHICFPQTSTCIGIRKFLWILLQVLLYGALLFSTWTIFSTSYPLALCSGTLYVPVLRPFLIRKTKTKTKTFSFSSVTFSSATPLYTNGGNENENVLHFNRRVQIAQFWCVSFTSSEYMRPAFETGSFIRWQKWLHVV